MNIQQILLLQGNSNLF